MTAEGSYATAFGMPIVFLILIFGLVALVASAFVVLPMLRKPRGGEDRTKFAGWLALGAGLGVAAVGLGSYAALGQPDLAWRSLRGPTNDDYPALIATLARRMPNRPGDLEGWTLLGRGYLAYGNANQAAKAFGRAVDIAKAQLGAAPPQLLSSYGEALTGEAGEVTRDAETVFRQVLEQDPEDVMARYFVGRAMAQRGDKNGALQIWENLLAEAPPDAPWRGQLINQMAALRSETGGGAPFAPAVMVARLAAQLDANPNNIDGWVMLINSYMVLGDKEKAAAALAKARSVFANQADAQAALTAVAQKNALN